MTQKNKTTQVSFNLNNIANEEDKLIAILSEAGFDSFWQEENTTDGFIEKSQLETLNLKLILQEQFTKVPDFSIIKTEEKNWNEEWGKNYDPAIVAGKIYIYAPSHKIDKSYSILIEPKMSFGTAHHGTTASMLSFLLETDLKNKFVIDARRGTGILTIFAHMMGASEIFAYDNDPWSVENANENFTRNTSLNTNIELGEDELLEGKKCDIFLANIHKNVIIKDIPDYA